MRTKSHLCSQRELGPLNCVRAAATFLVTKTSYHLTNLWELVPNSSNVKPTGPVCWGKIAQRDLVHECSPSVSQPLSLPALPLHGDPGLQGSMGRSDSKEKN